VLEKGEEELLQIRNFGEKSLSELYEVLMDHGVDVASILAQTAQPFAPPTAEVPEEAEEEPSMEEEDVPATVEGTE
jgi:hypothetical protein